MARERADGLTLDSSIPETGLDSLERMEILASLEERFGGRFPEEILPQLESAREVVAAVQRYLGTEPRTKAQRPSGWEVPPECYDVACFPEYVKLRQGLDFLESSGIGNPYFMFHEGVTNDRAMIDGREVINFSAFNYLGMSGDPTVTRAVQEAVAKYGSSVSASRLVAGEKRLHRELEETLARFLGVEDVVTFVGGHATNETVIGHLFGPGDLILHDSLSHNSIVQGSILSGARRRPFPHNDYEAADRILAEHRHEYRRVLIVIEGVYSMDGDFPDLPRFIDVRKRHKTLLMIDEAHSAGNARTDRTRHRRTLWSRPPGCRHLDGQPQQVAWQLRGIHRRPEGVDRVSQVHRAGIRLRHGNQPAGGGGGPGGMSPAGGRAGAGRLPASPGQTVPDAGPRPGPRHRSEQGLARGADHRRQLNPLAGAFEGPVRPGHQRLPDPAPGGGGSAARLRFFICSAHTEEQIRYTIDTLAQAWERIDPQFGQQLGSPGEAVAKPSPMR